MHIITKLMVCLKYKVLNQFLVNFDFNDNKTRFGTNDIS